MWLADGPHGPCAVKIAGEGGSLAGEAAALARAAGPGVARLLDFDVSGRWIALEHLPGGRADDWARGQPLEAVVEFCAGVARALAQLHASGIIHGDVKPSNVLVAADGTPRLTDLGSAGESRDVRGGTPGFVAPERLAGHAATIATDLYGLGGLIYQLVTRVPPFRDADTAALAVLPLASLPEPPSSLRPRLAGGLDDLILSLLARRPASRPHSAQAVADLLPTAAQTASRPPVVGMARERERLRRAVIELLDGRPAAIVLYGPTGSGRRTLIREAVRTAAREGIRAAAPMPDGKALLRNLAVDGPHVLPLDGNSPGSETLALEIRARGLPCLVLVRADRPTLRLVRARVPHLSPPPLGVEDVARFLDGHGEDRRRAEELFRRSHGRPAALLTLVGGPVPMREIDKLGRRLLQVVPREPVKVPALAQRLGLSEHRLLDLAEPLMDLGLIAASADGSELSRTIDLGFQPLGAR